MVSLSCYRIANRCDDRCSDWSRGVALGLAQVVHCLSVQRGLYCPWRSRLYLSTQCSTDCVVVKWTILQPASSARPCMGGETVGTECTAECRYEVATSTKRSRFLFSVEDRTLLTRCRGNIGPVPVKHIWPNMPPCLQEIPLHRKRFGF
jgi:hypothetical protein